MWFCFIRLFHSFKILKTGEGAFLVLGRTILCFHSLQQSKRNVIGYFDSKESDNYKAFEKVGG